MDKNTTGIDLITTERQEQLNKHQYSIERDQHYTNDELVKAAMQYLGGETIDCWPATWDRKYYKPSADRVTELKRAGALIAAEIDRLNLASK